MGQLPKIVVDRLRAAAGPVRPGNGSGANQNPAERQKHAMANHPDADLLTGFMEQALAGQEREQVVEHLAACGMCRDVVALAAPESVAPALVQGPVSDASSWLRWPVLRWGSAAAVVAVGVIGIALYRNQPSRPPANQVASARSSSNSVAPVTREAVPAQGKSGSKTEPKKAETTVAASDRPSPDVREKSKEALAAPASAKRAPERMEVASAARVPARPLDKVAPKPTSPVATAEQAHVDEPSSVVAVSAGSTPLVEVQPQTSAGGFEMVPQPEKTFSLQGQPTPWGSTPLIGGTASAEARRGPSTPVTVASENRNNKAGFVGRLGKTTGFANSKSLLGTSLRASESGASESEAPAVLLNARWHVSLGALMRSVDEGRSWQTVNVGQGGVWRAVNANNSDVWVGGAKGALYHSDDGGVRWHAVVPEAGDRKL